jgi:hypothetical protein
MTSVLILSAYANEEYGEEIFKNVYKKTEGELTRYTHIIYARGYESEDHEDDHEHRRRMSHFWEDYVWEQSNCEKLTIAVGDCHTDNGGEDFSTLLDDVIEKWNNVLIR